MHTSLSDSVHRSIAYNANRVATASAPLRLSTWAPDGWHVECVTTPGAIAVANAEDPALPVILDAAEQAATHGEPVYLDFGAGGRWRFDLPTFDLPYDNPPAPMLREPAPPAVDPVLQAIADLLHPASEPDVQWNADTIEAVSDLLDTHPVIGPMIRQRRADYEDRCCPGCLAECDDDGACGTPGCEG